MVKVVSILPLVIGPAQTTTVTWNADKKGSYSVRVDGSDCSTGTQVATGNYNNAPSNVATKVGVASLAEGANTVRVCVTASSKTGSATGTVTRDTTPPTLTGTLTSSDSVQTQAYPGESVTVKVTANEPLTKLTVTCGSTNVAMSPSDSQHWAGVLAVTTTTPLGPLQCSAVGTDAVGNAGKPSAIAGVTVVPPAPSVSISSQPSASTTATTASFAWTTSGTVISTTCSLDGISAGCTSPQAYTALSLGSHNFTVMVSNAGGSGSASYTWTVLPSAPTVSITSFPAASTTDTTAGLAWTTSGTVTSTTCSLDGTSASCTSPQTYTNLSLGSHTFMVTVSNAGGNGSAAYTWTVLPSAPTVSINSHPDATTTATDADFAWTTTGTVATTTCALDGTDTSCTSPQAYTNLTLGSHTFQVTVANTNGSSMDSYTWTVLPSAPTVSISSHPDSATTATDAEFTWATTGTVATTTCTVDGADTNCTSPQSYTNLGPGNHAFSVTVANAGGTGTDSFTWTVLPPAPTVSISSHPDASTTATDASFAWTTTGIVATTTCTLDGGDISCTSPQSYTSLAPGSHSFQVTVTNTGGTGSDSFVWTVVPPPSGCSAPAPSGYTLVFCDDFDGSAGAAPDSSKWRVYGGSSPSRWGQECFVNDPQHIHLDGNGNLVETATYNPGGVPCTNGSGPYESGGMDTGKFPTPLFSLEYGEVEARIKVPCQSGYGMWPAWWMAGSTFPQSGEVDILEVLGNSSAGYGAKQSIHGATSAGSVWSLSHSDISPVLWCTDYHVYGLRWSAGEIDLMVDGTVQATFTPASLQQAWQWPFDSFAEKLFLDLQVGGSGGAVDNSTFPQSMLIDWVRVYE